MKKSLFLGLLALTAMTSLRLLADCLDSCKCENTGKSYMAVRPLFQSWSPELVSSFREEFPGMRQDGYNSAFQAVIFGSRSLDSDDFARYFTPFCHDECPSLIVDERASEGASVNPAAGAMDLRATHFNIFTVNQSFRSRIALRPKRTEVGLGLAYRKDGLWRNEAKGRQFYVSANGPITHVKTAMRLEEEVIDNGGGVNENATITGVAQPDMISAFKQAAWNYGKIFTDGNCSSSNDCADSYSKTKIGDIELKIGLEWIDREPVHLESYIGILVPTGNKPEGKILFEPIVGHGKHFGIIFGSSAGIEIWRNEETDRVIRVETACHTQYLFKKTHIRAVDLKGKPWSRYMQVYMNEAQAEEAAALAAAAGGNVNLQNQARNFATPGINVFTFAVDVTPGFSTNTNTALVLTCGSGFQCEAGYNFYARRSECIKFSDKCNAWKTGPALKHESGGGFTNPVRDITGNYRLELALADIDVPDFNLSLANYENNQIQQTDFDLFSAAQPCALSHTLYGVLGYRWEEREYPAFLSAGGSCEFSHSTNAIMERWVLWGKVGVSF